MNRNSNQLQPTRDHLVPRSHGGRSIIICCLQCNGIKADMLPDQWASYMAANPGWWLLTRAERRARAREPRKAARLAKWGPRQPLRQGSPKPAPVVVPPELIYSKPLRMADSQFILQHGKKAFRRMERLRSLTPELIAKTVEEDAKIR
jgi:hypothetical protein